MPRKSSCLRAAALLGVALLASPPLAFAQSSARPRQASASEIRWTGPAEPVCVYKSVMTDAEIEACTRRPVVYDYHIVPERKAAAFR